MSKFLIRAVASGFKFDLYAPNGQAIASSEVYDTKAACRKGIGSVRKNAATQKVEDQTEEGYCPLSNPKYELFRDRAGQYRFRLKASNGKIIAVSEDYGTRAACENGIQSVQANAADAELEE